ncbi:xanthine dehydrogenase molybdopterin binding subunit [Candidatus Thiothrix sp. Deng01]|uniref:Xanthine dehydrogenase molybdopterin binding subunit n=1 Tax=Candidatus Thiothrix phosphatis TaxID=3112415 RepID=A0ABU6D4J5_9GAMM|nr:xanthine dehydrogenase molybdopterin binding subunit [Candidatus Thiothrix sp. Deng01]MEB4593223.1 xanthine dehydrogenase molybdopterin binding subunit [Candidatus Thiothrix sp. Deng01]
MTLAQTQPRHSVGQPTKHDSAELHVTGAAQYTDDIPEPRGTLYAAIGISQQAHARLCSVNLEPVWNAPGVVAVITAADIPGANHLGGSMKDEPVFAIDVVEYIGQPIFAVAATTMEAARRAAQLAEIDYETLPHNLDIQQALAQQQFVLPSKFLQRGQPDTALQQAAHKISGGFHLGGQEQFYLEGMVAMALPREHGDVLVYNSTQHPHHDQKVVADVLGLTEKDVVIECRRMGGAFGGKESQPSLFASIAALLALKTGRAVKLRLDRDDDITITGKRHCYDIQYQAGFDDAGVLQAVKLVYASRCGISADLSGPVNDRSMFHADNAYYLEHVDIASYRCKTNSQSNTAFRGFGGPQGMIAIEYIMDDVARHLQLDPLQVRRANFYGVDGTRNQTHYGMEVEDNIIHRIVDELETSADYQQRRAAIREFNRNSPWLKKGIALTPVKFGISFTATFYNQAGALLHIYSDGSVQLNHGGMEMGQGLYTKVSQVVAEELQVPLSYIRCTATRTDKVPNASATAASSGSDLNGMAARDAAQQLKQRLTAFAASHYGEETSAVVFHDGEVQVGEQTVSFKELAHAAWMNRISLSATGFYRTPKIHYDPQTMTGRPFYYFAYGAAVSEVMIDTLTGENRVLRVDILHDVGQSLNPALDIGQIEGGFIQGMGWLTTEELWWDAKGRLRTHAPSTYKIPVAGDIPPVFHVKLLENNANVEQTIYRSKAVGEPPLMLAMSVFFALRDAVASVGDYRLQPPLQPPATPEAILNAVQAVQSAHQETA